MDCRECEKYEICTDICEDVANAIYTVSPTCMLDAGVYCLAGNPTNMYHNQCDESTCLYYKSQHNYLKEEVKIAVSFKEYAFSNDDIGRIALSKYNTGEIIDSDGYTRVDIPEISTSPSLIATIIRNDIQHIIISNDLDLFTIRQRRALRLYYGLITKRNTSFQRIADIMGISKMKAVHHVYVGISKLRVYMLFIILGEIMNEDMLYELERNGINSVVGIKTNLRESLDMAKVKAILLSKSVDKILTRKQFETLWLFCGVDGTVKHRVGEIAKLYNVSEGAISSRIDKAFYHINEYIISKLDCNTKKKVCAARDCNNKFKPISDDNIYCCSKCKDRERIRRFRDNKRKKLDRRVCDVCKKWYQPRVANQKYCSEQCAKHRKVGEGWGKPRIKYDSPKGRGFYTSIRIARHNNRVLYEEEERSTDIVAIAGG
jgi:predicted DNA-binding protein YlxM (UPF0122 family)